MPLFISKLLLSINATPNVKKHLKSLFKNLILYGIIMKRLVLNAILLGIKCRFRSYTTFICRKNENACIGKYNV